LLHLGNDKSNIVVFRLGLYQVFSYPNTPVVVNKQDAARPSARRSAT
jgi:hypothetical protein